MLSRRFLLHGLAIALLTPVALTEVRAAGNGGGNGGGGNGGGGNGGGGNGGGGNGGGGNGGGGNGGGNGGGGNGGGGNGGGNSNAGGNGTGEATATGNAGIVSPTAKTEPIAEPVKSSIRVRHKNGFEEILSRGRYHLKDNRGRTVVNRPATNTDVARLRQLNGV